MGKAAHLLITCHHNDVRWLTFKCLVWHYKSPDRINKSEGRWKRRRGCLLVWMIRTEVIPETNIQICMWTTPVSFEGGKCGLTAKEYSGVDLSEVSPPLQYGSMSHAGERIWFIPSGKAKHVSLIDTVTFKKCYEKVELVNLHCICLSRITAAGFPQRPILCRLEKLIVAVIL